MSGIALIPPHSMVEDYSGKYYLYLPQLFDTNPKYDRFVETTHKSNSFTILDNGAFEGYTATSREIMDLAIKYNVDELVVPDVIGDCNETLVKIGYFASATKKIRTSMDSPRSYMAVVQGKSFAEAWSMVQAVNQNFPFITTLGIPKHLVKTVGIKTRVDLVRRITSTYGDKYHIHFLGSSPLWPGEIAEVNYLVRSMDTSMPFVFNFHSKSIAEDMGDFERPDDYFETFKYQYSPVKLDKNIQQIREWAGLRPEVRYNKSDG